MFASTKGFKKRMPESSLLVDALCAIEKSCHRFRDVPCGSAATARFSLINSFWRFWFSISPTQKTGSSYNILHLATLAYKPLTAPRSPRSGIMRLWLSVLGRIAKRLGHGCSLTDLIGADNTAAAEDLLNTVRPLFSSIWIHMISIWFPYDFHMISIWEFRNFSEFQPDLQFAVICSHPTRVLLGSCHSKIQCFMLIHFSGLRWPLPSGAKADELQRNWNRTCENWRKSKGPERRAAIIATILIYKYNAYTMHIQC